jgi:GTP-binding protein
MAIDFRNIVFAGVAANLEQCPPATLPEIILSGRSNVGKSSLINALAENRRLARISSTPGKTRMIVYFNLDNQLLIADLPGFGHAGVSQATRAAYSGLVDRYLNSGRPIALVLHLLDIRHAPTDEDTQMLAWLRNRGIPCLILLAKADKLSRGQMIQRRAELAKDLPGENSQDLLLFSASARLGLAELRRKLAALADGTLLAHPRNI